MRFCLVYFLTFFFVCLYNGTGFIIVFCFRNYMFVNIFMFRNSVRTELRLEGGLDIDNCQHLFTVGWRWWMSTESSQWRPGSLQSANRIKTLFQSFARMVHYRLISSEEWRPVGDENWMEKEWSTTCLVVIRMLCWVYDARISLQCWKINFHGVLSIQPRKSIVFNCCDVFNMSSWLVRPARINVVWIHFLSRKFY